MSRCNPPVSSPRSMRQSPGSSTEEQAELSAQRELRPVMGLVTDAFGHPRLQRVIRFA